MSLLNINQHGGLNWCGGRGHCSRRRRNSEQGEGGVTEVTRLSGDQAALSEDQSIQTESDTGTSDGASDGTGLEIIPQLESRKLMDPWSTDLQRAIREAKDNGGYWRTTHRTVNIKMCIPGSSDCLGPILSFLHNCSQNKQNYASIYRGTINSHLNAILEYLDAKIDLCEESDYPVPKNYDDEGYFEIFAENNRENTDYWCQTVIKEYGEQLKNAYITGTLIRGYEHYNSRMEEYISKLIPKNYPPGFDYLKTRRPLESIDEIVHKHTLLSFLNQYFETDIIQAGYVYEAVKMLHNDYINDSDEAAGAGRRDNFFSNMEIYGYSVGGKRRKKKSNKKKRKITKKNNKKKTKKKNNRKKTKKRKK